MQIFLSAPFSSMVQPDGRVEPHYRNQIQNIISVLEQNGNAVYCDMRMYNWRLYHDGASQAFWTNINAIQNCDLFIALPRSNPVSAGVELELGVAYALKKQIIVLAKTDDIPMPIINKGLIEKENIRAYTYQTLNDIPSLIKDKIVTPKS